MSARMDVLAVWLVLLVVVGVYGSAKFNSTAIPLTPKVAIEHS